MENFDYKFKTPSVFSAGNVTEGTYYVLGAALNLGTI